ncbi:MAG: glycosyltransferase family 9 protein [Terriglobales bacterium]
MSGYSRILLIHFGQMGDAVMALPAALALQRHFPAAELTVLAARGSAPIFTMAGFAPVCTADRVRWKRNPAAAAVEIPTLLWRLRRQRFELSVDLHSYKETNLLAALAGIPQRVAMRRPTRSWPRLINVKPEPDDPLGVLRDRYCRVLEPLGIAVINRVPRLCAPAQARARVKALFQDWSRTAGDAPILGLCPGAGHASRRWPAANFAALATQMQSQHSARIAVFAGPEESENLLQAFRQLPNARIWRGLKLEELAAALALCRVVVSNPTGPSHVAAAVGASLLTLGELPMFDPVAIPPAKLVALRSLPDIGVEAASAALLALWN